MPYYLFRHKRLNLSNIFYLVLLFLLPHKALCTLKSPISIIDGKGGIRISLIFSYPTWSVAGGKLSLYFFLPISAK